MKILKRIGLILLLLLVLFVGALVAIPYFFKDKIVATVKEEINNNVKAKVDFAEVDLSLIRSFPDLSIRLNDLSVIGIDQYEGVELLRTESFDLTVDVMSTINSDTRPLEISTVNLVRPAIHVIVDENGNANYDITSPAAEDPNAEPIDLQIDLQGYSIEEGSLIYDDRAGDIYVDLQNVNHEGSGDFTLEFFDLETTTNIAAMTVRSGGITYLKNAKVDYDAGFNIDVPNSKYTLKENQLLINNLELKTDGWIAMPSEDIDMDLTFEAPQNNFKNLLSLIPNAFIADYDDVKADGKFALNGFVKGTYSINPDRYPTFKVNLNIDNGNIKYPDLPVGINDIFTDLIINSPTPNLNDMLVNINRFKLNVGNNPLNGYFKLKTPLTDPDIDTKITGLIDLADINRAFPMENVEKMDGKIEADILAKTKMSTIERQDYGNVQMAGDVKVAFLNYKADGMPLISIKDLDADFNPKAVVVENLDAKFGESDVRGSGRLDNILAYFMPEKTMQGQFAMQSQYINADEWMTTEETATTPQNTSNETTETEIFDRFDFDMDAKIDRLKYDVYDIKNITAKGAMTPRKLTIDNFGMNIFDSDLKGNGYVDNVFDYLFENKTLEGQMNLSSNYFNLNPFMAESETATANPEPEALEPILVPENIKMVINSSFDKIHYTDMDLTNVNGKLVVADAAVQLQDVKAKALGGDLNIEGGYSTVNPEKPKFDFSYDLKNLDFQQAFTKLNTIAAIAPIGKFIEGRFSSNLKMSSELGKDFMPNLETLMADGFFATFNSKLRSFPPLEAIGNKLNIDELKSVKLDGTKNWFVVKDGRFTLEPFDYEVKNIAMHIDGSHLLTGNMDYNIKAKIPRKMLDKIGLGAAADKGINLLAGQASKLGLDLNVGEFVDVNINVLGSMTDPQIKLKLLGTSGDGGSMKDAVVENVKDKAKEEFDKRKEEAEARLQAEKKRAEARARAEAERLKEKAKREAERKAEELKRRAEREAKKRLNDEAEKLLKDKLNDEAKDKLKNLNPFGKKDGG